MLTERTIINALIMGASFIFAPFLVTSILSGDPYPLMLSAGLCGLVLAFCLLQDNLSIFPLLGLGIVGDLNFLPVPLSGMNIFCLLLIGYYLITYVVLRKRGAQKGLRALTMPISILAAIMLYHDHSFGLGILGSSSEGGRPVFFIGLAVAAYFCGIHMPSPSRKFLKCIPVLSLTFTVLTSIPFILTTFIPSLAPFLYYFTSVVNVDAYFESLTSDTDISGAGRLGALAGISLPLQITLLSYFPIGTWLRPQRWWVALLSIFCLYLTLSSGYRSNLFSYLFTYMIATWCYYSWRTLLIPVVLLFAGLMVYFGSTNNLIKVPLYQMPETVQRSLSFLPGDWDPVVVGTAEASNDFRKNIEDIYLREYFYKSPLLGNGLGFDTKEYNDAIAANESDRIDSYLQAKVFITAKMFHTGWISLYDAVGIVGSVAFVVLGVNQAVILWRLINQADSRQSEFVPVYVWLFCGVVVPLIGFFTVFGAFGANFPTMCVFALAISHYVGMENADQEKLVAPLTAAI